MSALGVLGQHPELGLGPAEGLASARQPDVSPFGLPGQLRLRRPSLGDVRPSGPKLLGRVGYRCGTPSGTSPRLLEGGPGGSRSAPADVPAPCTEPVAL